MEQDLVPLTLSLLKVGIVLWLTSPLLLLPGAGDRQLQLVKSLLWCQRWSQRTFSRQRISDSAMVPWALFQSVPLCSLISVSPHWAFLLFQRALSGLFIASGSVLVLALKHSLIWAVGELGTLPRPGGVESPHKAQRWEIPSLSDPV